MNSCDEDDESFEGLYEGGHWEWDEHENEMVFTSDLPLEDFCSESILASIFTPIEFKDDIDILNQHRFKKLYQRKLGDDDVVILQDIKDIVLFTAPLKVLTPTLVTVLHLPMTERFLRTIILYCQYYLQIADEMCRRAIELDTKIRTTKSEEIELQYRENLEDIRLLVAKEYCSMIMGYGDYSKHHHMGSTKKMRSLSKKDGILFETLLRISIQIIWIAFGRKSFSQIELEVHRLFKSQIFNLVERKLNKNTRASMTTEERLVLLGHCLNQNKKVNTRSPLFNEILCHRRVDFRILGLGVINFAELDSRLRFLEWCVLAPEIEFEKLGITLGIIGLRRSRFDIMLKEIKLPPSTASSSSVNARQSMGRLASRSSRLSSSARKSVASALQPKLYKDIVIPEPEERERLPNNFPTESLPQRSCNEDQKLKWLKLTSRSAVRRNRSKNPRS